MKKSLMVFAVLAGIPWGSLPAADFREGMEAYEKEDKELFSIKMFYNFFVATTLEIRNE